MKNKLYVAMFALTLTALPAFAGKTITMLNDYTAAYSVQILEDGFAGYESGTILQSFCLEASEYFTPGKSYYAVLGTSAIKGGLDWAGGVYGQGPRSAVSSDPVDARSAYLYTMFTNGDSRFTNQTMMQNAIHYIEGEIGTKNAYVTLAEKAVAQGGEWYGKGLGNVVVMTLWSNYDPTTGRYSGYVQDQLISTVVPAPGALALASIGMAVVGYIRRREKN